jgi:hypothetical protein
MSIDESELDNLMIWRPARYQPRPVAGFTVVNECQALTLQKSHRGLWHAPGRNLMHQQASAGGHAHRDLNGPGYVGIRGIGRHRTIPRAR